MIKEFVKAWDKNNKDLLEKYLKQIPNNYEDIVKDLIDIVINPYVQHNVSEYSLYEGLNVDKITVIDDGDYQGTMIYIVPTYAYQPSLEDYYYTDNYYGSCGGCDTFQGIVDCMGFDENGNYIITDAIAKEFHTLALHLLQNFKKLLNEDEEKCL